MISKSLKVGIAICMVIVAGYASLLVILSRPELVIKSNLQTDDYDINPSAFVLFSEGTSPYNADVKVIDLRGMPVSGASVGIGQDSGWAMGTTDTNGLAAMHLKERTFYAISLDQQRLVYRTNTALLVGSNGTSILIVKRSVQPASPKP